MSGTEPVRAKDVTVEKLHRARCHRAGCGWTGSLWPAYQEANVERLAHLTFGHLPARLHVVPGDDAPGSRPEGSTS